MTVRKLICSRCCWAMPALLLLTLGGVHAVPAVDPPAALPDNAAKQERLLYRQGLEYHGAQAYREAGRHFERLAKEAGSPAVHSTAQLAFAAACLADGRLKEAGKAVDLLLNTAESTPALQLRIAVTQGVLQWQSGKPENALATWKAALDGRPKVPRQGLPLLERLAWGARQTGLDQEAYHWQRKLLPLLRRTAPQDVPAAMQTLLRYPVRIKPDLTQLATLYRELQGFERNPLETVPEAPSESKQFWTHLRRLIRQFDDFSETQTEQRRHYYQYWARAMNGYFPNWDEFQIDRADFRYIQEQDRQAWQRRLEAQYKRGDPSSERMIQWIRLYKDDPQFLDPFSAAIPVADLPPSEALRVARTLFEYKSAHGVARRFLARIDLAKLSEKEKLDLARFLWHRAPDVGRRVCEALQDRSVADLELLRFFHWRRNPEEGIPVAMRLLEAGHAVDDVEWMRAELLEWAKRYEEAAAAFRNVQRQPDGIMRAAACQAAADHIEGAVCALTEAAKEYPEQAQQLLLQAAAMTNSATNSEQQRALLEQVVEIAPDSAGADEARKQLAALDEQ